jgi:hypothetical protein
LAIWYGSAMPFGRRIRTPGAVAIVAIAGLAAVAATQGIASSGSPDPSGQRMPKGNPAGWRPVFSDDFTQTVPIGSFPAAVAGKWGNSYRDGLLDTSKQGTYEPTRVVSIGNGVLNIHVHTEAGIHMVAALLPTIPGAQGSGGGLLYGRYSVRLRADPASGYKVSMLLWPDSGTWPADGEIDFPETALNTPIGGFVHFQNGRNAVDQVGFRSLKTLTRWHTWTITWLPTGIAFQVEGRTVGKTRTRIPDTPMHLVIQAETRIHGGVLTPTEAANIQIDWLTISTPACNRSMSVVPRAAVCTQATRPKLPT